jgi:hypothetical protein
LIHYVVEQEVATQGIRISRGVELILVIRHEINQQNGSINNGVPRDWNRGIHSVNIVPRPNSPRCTYCHQIGYQINQCPFIEDNVKQGFAEHFQNLNLEPSRIKTHGPIEPEDLYHEKVKILNKLREQI